MYVLPNGAANVRPAGHFTGHGKCRSACGVAATASRVVRRHVVRVASRSVVRLGLLARHRRRSAIDSMDAETIDDGVRSVGPPPLVELVGVVKTFGAKTALADVSWSVPAGQI